MQLADSDTSIVAIIGAGRNIHWTIVTTSNIQIWTNQKEHLELL